MNDRSLLDRKALVTGAGNGIGRATAEKLAEQGAWVACADIDSSAAEETANTIQQRTGKAIHLTVDVGDEQSVKTAIADTDDAFNGFDILFNNAGIAGGEWNQTISINLSGVFYGLAHGAARMVQNEQGGAIINTASVAGLVGLVGPSVPIEQLTPETFSSGAAYIASKHGVAGLTKQYAVMYGERGVRVNAVAPGYIETNMTQMVRSNDDYRDLIVGLHPMKRMGQAYEIAAAVAFLASNEASFITGVVLPVDGGYTAR